MDCPLYRLATGSLRSPQPPSKDALKMPVNIGLQSIAADAARTALAHPDSLAARGAAHRLRLSADGLTRNGKSYRSAKSTPQKQVKSILLQDTN